MNRQLRLIVSGRVQGVGFRFFTQLVANNMGLSGFACNHPDRTVEIIAIGDESVLVHFLSVIEKGSPFSRVDRVLKSWSEPTEKISGFHIR